MSVKDASMIDFFRRSWENRHRKACLLEVQRMERDSAHYIAWRSALVYNSLGGFGGVSVNMDDRLWNDAGGPFVLSVFRNRAVENYAVSDADAEAFIQKVLHQSEADVLRPAGPAADPHEGTEVRIGKKRYPFRDAKLMKQWLEELQVQCGEPLTNEEAYRYAHPAPVPPAGDVEVIKIVEQAVLPQRPAAVLGPGPDNCRSELLVEDGFAVLSVFQDGMHLEYILPPALLPEVNAAARAMLDDPGDGYHTEWDADAWLKVKGREEEFDAKPEDVLKLFASLAGRCGDPIPRKDHPDFYKVWLQGVRDKLANAWDCPLCAWKRNTAAFCEGCGAKRQDIPSGRAVSMPKPKAPAPWSCLRCGTVGNSGSYCCECGGPVNVEERFTGESGPIGYRRGAGWGIGGSFGAFWPMPTPPPQKPEQAAPAAVGEWFCTMCGARNSGKFCTECGKPKEQ
jgi:hypothetical protein